MSREDFIYHWMIAHINPIVEDYRKDHRSRSVSERDIVGNEIAKAGLMYDEIAIVVNKKS